MKKIRVHIDVEASGPIPGDYSMLSFGACLSDNPKRNFYVELAPISGNYVLAAMRIGCLWLESIDRSQPQFNVQNEQFDPVETLTELTLKAAAPLVAMQRLHKWLLKIGGSNPNRQLEFWSDNPSFDGMFLYWYWHHYLSEPDFLGHNIHSTADVFKGYMGSTDVSYRSIQVFDNLREHHAGDDAIKDALKFTVLRQLLSGNV